MLFFLTISHLAQRSLELINHHPQAMVPVHVWWEGWAEEGQIHITAYPSGLAVPILGMKGGQLG